MTPKLTKYIPHKPTAKQQAFLLLDCLEAMYGGAAGGGKSDALLMAALQYVDIAGYSALLLRRTFADLALPGAVMDRSHDWLEGTDAKWNDRDKTWTFPAGATLTFGYLAGDRDKYRYQSAEFQFIGFDELTQFMSGQYTYLFSRLRRRAGVNVPLRMRAASNPGGVGHGWVYERFMPDLTPEAVEHRRKTGRIFIPAKLADNPHIDQVEYRKGLAELDDVEQKQLEDGLWVTDPAGKPFLPEWWRRQNRFNRDRDRALLYGVVGRWQSWDTATKDGEHNSFTAEVQVELTADYRLLVTGALEKRLTVPFLADAVREAAVAGNGDGKLEAIIIEDKSSGTGVVQTLRLGDDWLAGKLVAFRPNNYGDKVQRAQQAALWCKRNCVLLPEPSADAPWLYNLEKQLYAFPDVEHDDLTDALTQAIIFLEHLLAAGWRARGGGV